MALYYKMFYHIRSAAEPHYQKAAKWAFDFEAPFRKIQDEFRYTVSIVSVWVISLIYMQGYQRFYGQSVSQSDDALYENSIH